MQSKLQIFKSDLPLKAYPKEELDKILIGDENDKEKPTFSDWVSDLLSLYGEDSARKIIAAMPAIKKHFWSLGLKEVKNAFEMYADGEMSIKPRSNYFDRVLVGQIFNEYRNTKRTKPTKKDLDQQKIDEDILYTIQLFDFFVQERKIPKDSVWVYEYLEEKGLINYSAKEKKGTYSIAFEQYRNKEEAIESSKRTLVRRYFERLEAKGQHIKDKL